MDIQMEDSRTPMQVEKGGLVGVGAHFQMKRESVLINHKANNMAASVCLRGRFSSVSAKQTVLPLKLQVTLSGCRCSSVLPYDPKAKAQPTL